MSAKWPAEWDLWGPTPRHLRRVRIFLALCAAVVTVRVGFSVYLHLSPAAHANRLLDQLRPPGRIGRALHRAGIGGPRRASEGELPVQYRQLVAIGPAATPALMEALDDDSGAVRDAAVYALGRVGRPPEVVIPVIRRAQQDPSYWLRATAARSLASANHGADPPEEGVMPGLLAALKDEDWRVRSSAARALRFVGPAAGLAVPALIEALNDEDYTVRNRVRVTLHQVLGPLKGRVDKDAVPGLIDTLKGDEWEARYYAAEALGTCGPDAAEAVPALTEALTDEHESVRYCAAWALGRIGPAAASAFWPLKEVMQDEHECQNVREAAARALKAIGRPPERPTVPPEADTP